jgi:diguanylate cyclase (GGDEF)-like protein
VLARPLAGTLLLLRQLQCGCWRRGAWTGAALLRLGLVFALAIVLSHQSEGVATIWLSNGLLFGLLITQPKQRWLAYFLVGLTADTLADMLYGDPFRLAIGVSAANSIEVIGSTLLLTLWLGSPLDLARRKPLVGFLLISVLGATALTSAVGASWTLLFVDAGPWWQMFRTWYLGDILGMAILAPLIVIVQRPAFFSMFARRQLLHTLLVLSAAVLVAALVFTHSQDPLIFLLFPALLLVVFRLGFPGTVVTILLVTLMAIGFTVKGYGPLMLIPGEHMLLHRIVIAQVFGAIAIFTLFPVAALLEERQRLRDSLATSEARFRNLAHADELTGLLNRRAFNLQLESAWGEALMQRQPLALVLLDADLFKQYNDVFGHLGGDECLRQLAAVISRMGEEAGGVAARFGGEEFAVILPHATQFRAVGVAEQIRKAILGLGMPHPTSPAGVQTVSVGVAALLPAPEHGATHLLRLADQALYTSKHGGRNCVSSA